MPVELSENSLQNLLYSSFFSLSITLLQFAGKQLVRQQADPLQEEQHQGAGGGKHLRGQGGGRRGGGGSRGGRGRPGRCGRWRRGASVGRESVPRRFPVK